MSKSLTREQMVEHLKAGRSLLVDVGGAKVHVTKMSELPSDLEMAKGNPEAEQKVVANLLKQQAEIQGQLHSLGVQTTILSPIEPTAVIDDTEQSDGQGNGQGVVDPNQPNQGSGEAK